MPDTDTMARVGYPESEVAETADRPGARALETESRADPAALAVERAAIPTQSLQDGAQPHRGRVLPFVITVAAVVVASVVTMMMWNTYMDAPWTRDGTVRAYVVTMAPEVSGRIVELPVADNQFVHKGDLLMTIDPTNYKIAVSLDEAAVEQAQANMQNTAKESQRRQLLTDLAVTTEEKQTYAATQLLPMPSMNRLLPILSKHRSISSGRKFALPSTVGSPTCWHSEATTRLRGRICFRLPTPIHSGSTDTLRRPASPRSRSAILQTLS
jgi:hypothetical protein